MRSRQWPLAPDAVQCPDCRTSQSEASSADCQRRVLLAASFQIVPSSFPEPRRMHPDNPVQNARRLFCPCNFRAERPAAPRQHQFRPPAMASPNRRSFVFRKFDHKPPRRISQWIFAFRSSFSRAHGHPRLPSSRDARQAERLQRRRVGTVHRQRSLPVGHVHVLARDLDVGVHHHSSWSNRASVPCRNPCCRWWE